MIPYNDSQLKPNKNKRVYIIKFQNDNKMKLKTYITIMLMFIIGSCGNDDKPEDPALREIELMKKEEELRKREEELVKRELDVLKWETQNDTLKIEDITKDTLNIVDDIQNTELTHDKKIELIRKEYNNINNNIKSYSKETKELSGFSTEGGELDIFTREGDIKKLTANHYGEMGKRVEEYYYKNGKPIFIYSKLFNYDKPFGDIIETEENKFYLGDNKLIKWLDSNNETVNPETTEFSKVQKEILNDSETYLKLVKK